MNFAPYQPPNLRVSAQDDNAVIQNAVIQVQQAVELACPHSSNDVRTEALLQTLYQRIHAPMVPVPHLDGLDVPQWEERFFAHLTELSDTIVSNQIHAIQRYVAGKVMPDLLDTAVSSLDRSLAIGLHYMTEACKARGLQVHVPPESHFLLPINASQPQLAMPSFWEHGDSFE